jgi:flagellar hook assembly protein FlgD
LTTLSNTIDFKTGSLRVSPNPFSEVANIELMLQSDANVSLKVYTLNGKIVSTITNQRYNKGKNNFILQDNQLPKGVYLLNATINGSSYLMKLMHE